MLTLIGERFQFPVHWERLLHYLMFHGFLSLSILSTTMTETYVVVLTKKMCCCLKGDNTPGDKKGCLMSRRVARSKTQQKNFHSFT